jgi:hypothetical protein
MSGEVSERRGRKEPRRGPETRENRRDGSGGSGGGGESGGSGGRIDTADAAAGRERLQRQRQYRQEEVVQRGVEARGRRAANTGVRRQKEEGARTKEVANQARRHARGAKAKREPKVAWG